MSHQDYSNGDELEYVGDATGTELTPGSVYTFGGFGVDNVILKYEEGGEPRRIEITKEEFDYHDDLGTLTETIA